MSAPFLTMDELDHPLNELNKFSISYISPEAPDWSFCAEEATPGFVFPENVPELDKLMLVESKDLHTEFQEKLGRLKAQGPYKQYNLPGMNGIQISRELDHADQPHVHGNEDNLVNRGRNLRKAVIMLFGKDTDEPMRYAVQVESEAPGIPNFITIVPVALCTMVVVPIRHMPGFQGISFAFPADIDGGQFLTELRWVLAPDQFRRFNKLTEEWLGNYRPEEEEAATRKPVESSAGESKLLRDEGRRDKLLARLGKRDKKQRK